MSEFFNTVQSDSNFLEKIASKIPGFKGYVETTQRRASDKLLRDEIARQFSQIEARVSNVQTEAISMGAIELIDTLERSAIKLRTFADRIRGASYGYSALFAPVKIKPEDLAKMYAYDLALLAMAEDLNAAVDNVEGSLGTDGIDAAIRHLVRLSQEAIDAYDNRHNVIIDGGGAAEMPSYHDVPAPDPSTYESLPDDQEPLSLDE
jgi:hypothetical protein